MRVGGVGEGGGSDPVARGLGGFHTEAEQRCHGCFGRCHGLWRMRGMAARLVCALLDAQLNLGCGISNVFNVCTCTIATHAMHMLFAGRKDAPQRGSQGPPSRKKK